MRVGAKERAKALALWVDPVDRVTEYLCAGGLFNPECMEHDKVRDLLIACRDEILRLRRMFDDVTASTSITDTGAP